MFINIRASSLQAVVVDVCVLLAGCTLAPIKPEAKAPAFAMYQKPPVSALLVLSPELQAYRHVGRPDGWVGSAGTFQFEIGEPLGRTFQSYAGAEFETVFVSPRLPDDWRERLIPMVQVCPDVATCARDDSRRNGMT